jgi:hypothetical protein
MCAKDLLGFSALGILDLLVVQEADLRRKVEKPVPVVLHQVNIPLYFPQQSCTHLLVRHRVVHQRHESQLLESSQYFQVGELSDIVLGQDEGIERRHALDHIRLNALNPVPRA